MKTYLLKWNPNPKKSPWADLAESIEHVGRKGFSDGKWSCGNNKSIQLGDRVFMLRTRVSPRGIMASGVVIKEPYVDVNYDPTRPKANALYVGIRFDALLPSDSGGILEMEQLKTGPLTEFLDKTKHAPSSGITVPPLAAAELEAVWSAFLTARGKQPIFLAEEVNTPAHYFEGATRQIFVNIYERNPYARQRCIEHYKCRCFVCGFDFELFFGEIGRGLIHVHHLRPLAEVQKEYELDPIADLRPICPNCHAMIHRGTPMMTIEALKQLIENCKTSSC